MSRKYAIVVSADLGILVGVNTIMNGLKYYDNEVDFHLLYWGNPADFEPFFQSVRDNGFYPELFPVNLREYAEGVEGELKQAGMFYLASYRYHYCASLQDYDAVLMLDADTAIVNNIMWFFDIAASTGAIILPNNNVSGEEYDTCELIAYASAAVPPLHCHPLFFKPSLYKDVFSEVPKLCNDTPMDDMSCCNYVLVKHGLMRTKVFVQPNLFWVNTSWDYVPVQESWIGGKRFLVVNRTDRLYILHGRWWYAFNMEKFSLDPKTEYEWNRNHTLRLMWETYYFFNNKCFHNFPWDEEQWGEPGMFDKLNEEKVRWRDIRPRWPQEATNG